MAAIKLKCPIHGVFFEKESYGGVIEEFCPDCRREYNTPEAANRRTRERAERRRENNRKRAERLKASNSPGLEGKQ